MQDYQTHQVTKVKQGCLTRLMPLDIRVQSFGIFIYHIVYSDQLLCANRQIHVAYSDQLLGAARHINLYLITVIKNCGICLIIGRKSIRVTQKSLTLEK